MTVLAYFLLGCAVWFALLAWDEANHESRGRFVYALLLAVAIFLLFGAVLL